MRILHLAPLWYRISKDTPGGIETLLADLVEAQRAAGHVVAIATTADSDTPARVIPVVDRGLVEKMKAGKASEYAFFEQEVLRLAIREVGRYDIIHSHVGPAAYVLSALWADRVLHTIHGPVQQDMQWYLQRHTDVWVTTVSRFQADKLGRQGGARCAVVYNGVALERFNGSLAAREGLLFLGRMEPEKGPDAAIRAARELGLDIVLAGPITDSAYFSECIEPQLDLHVRYIGVADEQAKVQLLQRTRCVLVPSRAHESFGMVCIEATACGTPVVGLGNGALPEVIETGVSGYVVDDEHHLSDAVRRAVELPVAEIRQSAARFSIAHTATRYTALYERIIAGGTSDLPRDFVTVM